MVHPKLQCTIMAQLSFHIHTTISLITSPHKVHCLSLRSLAKHLSLIPIHLRFPKFLKLQIWNCEVLKQILMQIQKFAIQKVWVPASIYKSWNPERLLYISCHIVFEVFTIGNANAMGCLHTETHSLHPILPILSCKWVRYDFQTHFFLFYTLLQINYGWEYQWHIITILFLVFELCFSIKNKLSYTILLQGLPPQWLSLLPDF